MRQFPEQGDFIGGERLGFVGIDVQRPEYAQIGGGQRQRHAGTEAVHAGRIAPRRHFGNATKVGVDLRLAGADAPAGRSLPGRRRFVPRDRQPVEIATLIAPLRRNGNALFRVLPGKADPRQHVAPRIDDQPANPVEQRGLGLRTRQDVVAVAEQFQ